MGFRDQIPLTDTEVWTISAKWGRHNYDCTPRGIVERCGGRCCSARGYWPPNAYHDRKKLLHKFALNDPKSGQVEVPFGKGKVVPAFACGRLTKDGCEFSREDMPITCLLHPMTLNKSNKLICPNWVTTKHGICKGAFDAGDTPLIKVLRPSFVVLFGEEQYEQAVVDILENNKDAHVVVTRELHVAYLYELKQAADGEKPIPRREMMAKLGRRR